MTTRARPSFGLTVLAVSLPMFMVALDNLVVTNALASIRSDLGSSLENLQWVTNAYVLGFAGLLLTAAGLGDRFGRRRVFLTGTVAFTLASVGCGLSNSTELLILFRALQGISASAVLPLSLTLLTVAVPQEKRGLAIGLWSAISSLAVALAPLVGGAITTGLDWHFIFLLNIPVGLVAVPLALKVLGESQGVATRLDVPGLVLAGGGVLALVWAIVNAGEDGWTSGGVLAAFMRRGRPAARVPRLGAPYGRSAAPARPLPHQGVLAGQPGLARRLLRSVRPDLPDRPVSPGGPGPLGVRGRSVDAAVGRHADADRPVRGQARAQGGRRTADGGGPRRLRHRSGVVRRGRRCERLGLGVRRSVRAHAARAWAWSSHRRRPW